MQTKRPNRRSIRLSGWDYRAAGYYFVTLCTFQRRHLFAKERYYDLATKAWQFIPQQPHANHVDSDAWILMPDHLHGILKLEEQGSATGEESAEPGPTKGPLSGALSAIIGNFKMLVTKRVRALAKASGGTLMVWQRGYWERIIRDEDELNATREYILANPDRWAEERDDLADVLKKMKYIAGP